MKDNGLPLPAVRCLSKEGAAAVIWGLVSPSWRN
jgi:hypothetical protein